MSVLADLQGKIGQQLGVSDWVEIPQARITQFAGCHRRSPIHPC